MKKIIALVVVIVMMAAMAVPAFAAPYVGGTETAATVGGTVITYGATQAYTVTIPENFNLAAKTWKDTTLSVSGYMIATTKTLSISVTSSYAHDNTWELREVGSATNAAPVPYQIKLGTKTTVEVEGVPTTKIEANGADVTPTSNVVLVLDTAAGQNGAAGAAVESYLCFYTAGTAQVATFNDTINFIVAITDKVPAEPQA